MRKHLAAPMSVRGTPHQTARAYRYAVCVRVGSRGIALESLRLLPSASTWKAHDPAGPFARHIPCLLLCLEAQRLAMATGEDRAMTNVELWILLWQKQIADKLERARAAA